MSPLILTCTTNIFRSHLTQDEAVEAFGAEVVTPSNEPTGKKKRGRPAKSASSTGSWAGPFAKQPSSGKALAQLASLASSEAASREAATHDEADLGT